MQTHALDPLILEADAVQQAKSILHYCPTPLCNCHDDSSVGRDGGMANHGASAAAMVNIADEKGDETKK